MKWWLILLFTGLIVMRFAYLDQDAPVYQFANISQEDEPYYCEGALCKLCNNEGRAVKGFEHTKGEQYSMYNKAVAYASFKIFGNNYWGLRIPDVIVSVLFLLLMYSIFRNLSPGNKFISVFFVLLLSNFYLFTFSRYNNPQIYSVLFITLTLWIVIKFGYEKRLPLIACGFFSAFSVLFVYPMNFFFLGAMSLFIIIEALTHKKITWPVFFLVGIVLCFFLLWLGLTSIGSNLNNFSRYLLANGAGNSGVLTSTGSVSEVLVNIYKGITAIIGTGYFRFQLVLLWGAIAILPLLILKAIGYNGANKNIALLVLLIMCMQVIQNYFALTYPFKKMLVTLPITAIAFFLIFKDLDLNEAGKTKWRKIIIAAWFVVAFFLCLFNFKINKSTLYWGYTGTGCFGTSPFWFDVLNNGTCAIFGVTILYILFYKGRRTWVIAEAALILSVVANLALIYTTYVAGRKYQVRDCLVGLAPMIHDHVVIGGFPFTYQLYNNCKPALHGYNINFISNNKHTTDSMLVNKKADFLIDKIMPNQPMPHANDTNLRLVKVYNFDCYSYYVYKNNRE